MSTDLVAPRSNVGGKRTALSAEQVARVREVIGEHPELSDGQIARIAQVSRAMVWKLRREQEDEAGKNVQDADQAQAELARLIGEHLPLMERVRLLGEVVRSKKANPATRLRAFELINEFHGMVTRKQQRDAEANAHAPGPIFVFQAQSVPSAAPVTLPVVVEADNAVVLPSVSKADVDKPTS